MPRTWSTTFRSGLEDPHDDDPILVFLEITNAGLADPIRVVSDHGTVDGLPVKYTYDGDSYIGFPFEIEILTDEDAPPRGRLRIANVDRRIGPKIQALTSAPAMTITIIAASEFDLTVNPRTAVGTPEVIYSALGLNLRNIQATAMDVTATITTLDDSREPWPAMRATQERLPGLFR